jgi:lipopolysaccharide transport system permease protein
MPARTLTSARSADVGRNAAGPTVEPVAPSALVAPSDPRATHRVRITGRRGWTARVAEIWQHRELLFFLTQRDLKIRYRQTFFGVAWAVAQPLALMAVFAIFIGRVIHPDSNGVPYPIFAFAAIVPWTLFAQAMIGTSQSLVRNANLVTKVYVPRLLVPLASSLSYLLDFLIAFTLLLLGAAFVYDMPLEPLELLAVVPLTGLAFIVALSVGTILAALNVMYRDVQVGVPLLSQLWLFATPILYSSASISEPWRTLYGLNPMSGVVEGFRWAVLDTPAPPTSMLLVSIATALALVPISLAYFTRIDHVFADVI